MTDSDTVFELEESSKFYQGKLILTQQRLIHQWNCPTGNTGSQSFVLSELSSDLASQTAFPKNAARTVVKGFFFLITAGCLFFSALQAQLSLLIGFFGLLGLLFSVVGLIQYRKRQTWTIVQRRDGSRATFILHDRCDPEKREQFEAVFSKTVKGENS